MINVLSENNFKYIIYSYEYIIFKVGIKITIGTPVDFIEPEAGLTLACAGVTDGAVGVYPVRLTETGITAAACRAGIYSSTE